MDLKEIEVEDSEEKWNYYELADGTTLKVKIVLIRVINEGDSHGNIGYDLQSAHVMGVKPPAELIGREQIDKFEDIEFNPTNDVWNKYKLKNGFTLMLKPALTQVNRTGERDPRGIPIYSIQAQPLIKIKK